MSNRETLSPFFNGNIGKKQKTPASLRNADNKISKNATMAHALRSTTNDLTYTPRKITYEGKPITDNILNGFFTVDRNWTVKYWNKAAEKLLGLEASSIVGKNLWEQFAGTLPVEFYEVYNKAFTNDVPIHFEEYWGEMGGWFNVITYYAKDTLSVSFKSSNQPFSHPYDQRVQRFDALAQLYKLITEVTNDCLWEWNFQTGEIFWIDGGHVRVFGYPVQNALIPESFWEARVHPDDRERVLNSLQEVKDGAITGWWEVEYRFMRANGEYAFVHDRAHVVYDEHQQPVRMVGATQDISKKILLQNKVIDDQVEHRKEITSAILSAQEKERSAIGQELHDNLNQILVVAKMYIQMSDMNEDKRKTFLDRASECITDVVQQIRTISKNLALPDTHISGISVNIESMLDDLVKVQPIRIEFLRDGLDESLLDDKVQLTLFRITQEQINNILKHSQATAVTIELKIEDENVVLRIKDNGIGCDLHDEGNGVGFINITSRVELHNGTVNRNSSPGHGYTLEVTLPLHEMTHTENRRAIGNSGELPG